MAGNLPEEGMGGGFRAGEAADTQSVLCRFQQPVNLAARYGQERALISGVMWKSGFRLAVRAFMLSLITGTR
jgi:hypothetical protein